MRSNPIFLSLSLTVLLIGIFTFTTIETNRLNHLSSTATAQQNQTNWPQFQADAQNTGRSTAFVPHNYQVAWAWFDQNHIVRDFVSEPYKNITDGFESGYKFTTIFARQVQPIVADGKAFFGALNGTMYLVDALNGDNYSSYQTQGPIMSTAAYDSGTLVFTSMDGSIYALDVNGKSLIWKFDTQAGINASPVISHNTVYVGSRDGNLYSLNLQTGALNWTYTTRVPGEPASPFASAPIMSPAAVNQDGSVVVFGAENMYVYALQTQNGQESWTPKKVIGQSFMYTWPVISGHRVVFRTMSSLRGAEFLMEEVLDALPSNPAWEEEKNAIQNWLSQNPNQKTMYVFNLNTGQEDYQVAMGRVSGDNYPPYPPVVDNQGRLLTYWRSKRATFVYDGPCFGTKYCPDISQMDITTGDRIKLSNPSSNKINPELDNGYMLSIGGNYMYLHNHFRGLHSIEMSTGRMTRITHHSAKWDGGDWRGWGYQIIFYGNDAEPSQTQKNDRPGQLYANPYGFSGTAIATTNGTTLLYVNEALAGGIVAIKQR